MHEDVNCEKVSTYYLLNILYICTILFCLKKKKKEKKRYILKSLSLFKCNIFFPIITGSLKIKDPYTWLVSNTGRKKKKNQKKKGRDQREREKKGEIDHMHTYNPSLKKKKMSCEKTV